jgi:3-hydroxyisobutyrate dehydrogenase-like beta-hydroxyacid dehydrogenase
MLEAADDMKIKLPFSETHFDLLERGGRLGMGDLDNSAIIKVIASLNEDNLNQ